MTKEQFKKLKQGDIIKSSSGNIYMIDASYNRVKTDGTYYVTHTAVKTVDVSDPDEWNLCEQNSTCRYCGAQAIGWTSICPSCQDAKARIKDLPDTVLFKIIDSLGIKFPVL